MAYYRAHILVCTGTGCAAANANGLAEEFETQLKKFGLDQEIRVVKTGCLGLCAKGPNVVIYPDGTHYIMVHVDDVAEIVEEHLLKGRPVQRLLNKEEGTNKVVESLTDTNFYRQQQRIALRNCGLKWQFTANAKGDFKYVCCNADEGDPGAFMDRSVLEGDPFSVVEAMTIAGYAVGSSQGYIYVRAEYPIAVERLNIAIKKAEEYGLLGDNIFETGFSFHLETRLGSGAFVCGEETALMVSIEGNRGEPRPRPPFPANKGLFGKPTLLNNVETYANITWIINNGAAAYAAIGAEGSTGTKVFALGGKIVNTGLVEIPMGTPLRTIIEDIGGGVPNGKKFKAVQTGGPSGACIPASQIDVPIDYNNLSKIGAMMGSGGMIVLDEDNCMVDIAKFFLQFTVDESCGKCTPCRVGIRRMLEILDKITEGKGTLEDIDRLEKLAANIKGTALCGLGQTAPNPVLSTIRNFRDEYIAHVVDKRCPAGVCKSLLHYEIDPEKCKGCSACSRVCPADAISGVIRSPFTIDTSKCIKCGSCIEKCKFGAISKV